MADLTVRAQGRKMCFVFTGWESNRTALEKSRIFGNPQPASLCACRTEKCNLFSPGGKNTTVLKEIKPHLSKAVAGFTARCSEAGYGFRKMRLCFSRLCSFHHTRLNKAVFLSCTRAVEKTRTSGCGREETPPR